jgi:hypothetical protein
VTETVELQVGQRWVFRAISQPWLDSVITALEADTVTYRWADGIETSTKSVEWFRKHHWELRHQLRNPGSEE